ncbi:replication-associated recombination protein A [Solirubrobacter sp. CPCC 204708]|nr:replication-associated recombination protein A [Solirubrobacter deserti]
MTLFEGLVSTAAPLAERMRPRNLDEVVGQRELTDPAGTLRRALASGQPHSLILWGPPGCGKTTIAQAIARESAAAFESLNAVTDGIADLRKIVARATERRAMGQMTILFIDEIARWSKSQQDALLPHVENGTITLLGATTEHPGHEIVRALRSRLKIYPLTPLSDDDLREVIERALADPERGLGGAHTLSEPALARLLVHADGDARSALNALQDAATTKPQGGEIDEQHLVGALGSRPGTYSRKDEYYAIISALIKSIRGSDTDASLYWLARLKHGGADPKVIARRLIVAAGEEIGTAAPGAIAVANSAFDAVERVGAPECWIPLAAVTATSRSHPRAGRPTTASRRPRRSSRPRRPTRCRRTCATRAPPWTSNSVTAAATCTRPSPAATGSSSCRTRCAAPGSISPRARVATASRAGGRGRRAGRTGTRARTARSGRPRSCRPWRRRGGS